MHIRAPIDRRSRSPLYVIRPSAEALTHHHAFVGARHSRAPVDVGGVFRSAFADARQSRTLTLSLRLFRA